VSVAPNLTQEEASLTKNATIAMCLPLFLALECGGRLDPVLQSAPGPRADSLRIMPTATHRVPVHLRRELVEASAAVMSQTQPGIVFTINDSGNDPMLFAIDTLGRDRGAWRVIGAQNVDWEAASAGPCGGGGDSSGTAVLRCLYLGDVGDNSARYPYRTIYRVTEPTVEPSGFTGQIAARKLNFVYPDSPHDVEAMYLSRDGTTYLITKRPLKDRSGRRRPALVFALPPSVWTRPEPLALAELVDSLPIIPGSAHDRLITDAALSPDGRRLAVRTYAEVYLLGVDPVTGRVVPGLAAICDVKGLGQRVGEGITWVDSRGRLLLMSEGLREPLWIVNCGG
jgi:hypothetical protein